MRNCIGCLTLEELAAALGAVPPSSAVLGRLELTGSAMIPAGVGFYNLVDSAMFSAAAVAVPPSVVDAAARTMVVPIDGIYDISVLLNFAKSQPCPEVNFGIAVRVNGVMRAEIFNNTSETLSFYSVYAGGVISNIPLAAGDVLDMAVVHGCAEDAFIVSATMTLTRKG